MTPVAISTGLAILAVIGLVIGLVVLLVVIVLLKAVLTPIREIAGHARDAPEVAPFITNGLTGVEDLSRTRDLARSVPPLAGAYLAKLSSGTVRRAPEAPSQRVGDTREGLISGGKP